MPEIKEMHYEKKRLHEILATDTTPDGYTWEIINGGWLPCAYVKLPSNHPYCGLDCGAMDVVCHGGLSYDQQRKDGFWIGWDYGHCDDYCGTDLMIPKDWRVGGKKWTTQEIIKEIENVINQLREVKQ